MRVQEETGLLGGYGGGGRPKMILYILIAVFIAWNILLFILSVVALAKVNNVDSGDTVKNYNLETVARDFEVATDQVLFTDKVVSLLPNGHVRLGAGITVFPAIGSVAPNLNGNSKYLHVVSFDLPFSGGINLANSEMIVLTWVDFTNPATPTAWAVVGVMSISSNTLKQWGTPKQIPGLTVIDDVVRVHQASVQNQVVLTFLVAGAGTYYIGQTTQDSMVITFSSAQTYDAGPGSNTELATLSPNMVVFAYYKISQTDGKHLMEAASCTINYNADGTFKDARMGTPDNYSTNKAYHTIFPLTATTFVLSYPSTNILKINETTNDTLISALGRVQNDGSIVIGPEKSLNGANPNFFMTAVGLNHERGVVIFVDQSDNYALKAVVVGPPTLPSDITPLDSVAYGSLVHLSGDSPSGGQLGNGTISYVAACKIDHWRFAVAFVDFANGGRLTTIMAEVDSITNHLVVVTPPFVISGPVPDSAKDYWWVTMAPLVTNHQIGYVVIDSLQEQPTDPGRRNNTIVEIAGRPFGIVKSLNGRKSTLALSGVHKFQDARFKGSVGRVFYATAQGNLVEDLDTGTQPEAYIDAGSVLVTYHNRVGVAISDTELLIGA